MNYYEKQLAKLISDPDYRMTMQIVDSKNNNTKWMDLNPESIPAIIEFLNSLIK